jgi:hypothetical protein
MRKSIFGWGVLSVACIVVGESLVYWKFDGLGSLSPTPNAACLLSHLQAQDVGNVSPGMELNVPFTIANVGAKRLVINKVISGCDCGAESLEGVCIVQPGEQRKLQVRMTSRLEDGPFLQEAEYSTNDPKNPRVVFSIQGIVGSP